MGAVVVMDKKYLEKISSKPIKPNRTSKPSQGKVEIALERDKEKEDDVKEEGEEVCSMH